MDRCVERAGYEESVDIWSEDWEYTPTVFDGEDDYALVSM